MIESLLDLTKRMQAAAKADAPISIQVLASHQASQVLCEEIIKRSDSSVALKEWIGWKQDESVSLVVTPPHGRGAKQPGLQATRAGAKIRAVLNGVEKAECQSYITFNDPKKGILTDSSNWVFFPESAAALEQEVAERILFPEAMPASTPAEVKIALGFF